MIPLARARVLVRSSSRIVGFTGAGISTESGIPDFRSPDGVWAKFETVYFDDFLENEEARIEYWRQKALLWPGMRDAAPNTGHEAFVRLFRLGKLDLLVTQNIDGLHQRAGLPPEAVCELHGTNTEAACLSCEDRIPFDEAFRRVGDGEPAPRCRRCGGLLKPATVSFGQALPPKVLARAADAARGCDLFLAVGSSLVVQPAAALPVLARQAGARLVIVNREPTPVDEHADLVLRGEIGEVLAELVAD